MQFYNLQIMIYVLFLYLIYNGISIGKNLFDANLQLHGIEGLDDIVHSANLQQTDTLAGRILTW